MQLADMHTHSDNSPDGSDTVMGMCENAVKKGLSYLAITDHCEINRFYNDRYNIGIKQSHFEISKAKTVFKNQLTLLLGVEIGQATFNVETADAVLRSCPYDVVLGSMHSIPNYSDFAFIDYAGLDVNELFNVYLDEVYKLIQWNGFDILSHLTYPLRYINGEHGYNVKTSDHAQKIEKVLKALIEKGKALEINTSGLRQAYGEIMPDLYCLKLYKDLGGELLTVGSDAHMSDDLGANIVDGLNLAKKAGFTKYCIYQNRKPVFIVI